MKWILLFSFFIFFAITSHAQQTAWFFGISHDSARAISDTFVSYNGDAYTFVSEDTSGQFNNVVFFNYQNANKDQLQIPFRVYSVGANADMEVKGKATYYFTKISGLKLPDVFPFWQRFIDPNAKKDDLASTGDVTKVVSPANGNIPAKKANLYKDDNMWELWIH